MVANQVGCANGKQGGLFGGFSLDFGQPVAVAGNDKLLHEPVGKLLLLRLAKAAFGVKLGVFLHQGGDLGEVAVGVGFGDDFVVVFLRAFCPVVEPCDDEFFGQDVEVGKGFYVAF